MPHVQAAEAVIDWDGPFELIGEPYVPAETTDFDLIFGPEYRRVTPGWTVRPLDYACLPGWYGIFRDGVQVWERPTFEAAREVLAWLEAGASLSDLRGYGRDEPFEPNAGDAFGGHPVQEGGAE